MLTFFKQLFLLLAFFSIQTSFAQLSGIYSIDSSNTTTNRNFQSFKEFTDRLDLVGVSDSVIVNVITGSGPYNEQVMFSVYPGMSSQRPIIIKGNGETLTYDTHVNSRDVMRFNGARHIIIDSLNIIGNTAYYGYGIRFVNNADSNMIINSHIQLFVGYPQGWGADGIYIKKSDYNAIINNTIIGGSNNDVFINNSNHTLIQGNLIGSDSAIYMRRGIFLGNDHGSSLNIGNKIINNKIIHFDQDGIYAVSQSDITISGNNISSPNANYYQPISSHTGIYLYSELDNALIEKNLIHNLNNFYSGFSSFNVTGIYAETYESMNPRSNMIVNNVVKDIKSSGSNIHGINLKSTNFLLYHNTIILDDTSANSGFTKGINVYTLSSMSTNPNIFKNNIIYITRGGSGIKHGVYLNYASSIVYSDFNNIYLNSKGSGLQHIGHYNGNQTSIIDWKTVNSNHFGQNSLFLDPKFQQPDNFYPTNINLANKGDSLGIYTDFLDSSRNIEKPYMGAIETKLIVAIQSLNKVNHLGLAKSLNKNCWTTGTVVGGNLTGTQPLNFYLIDQSFNEQNGIRLIGDTSLFHYSVKEGDSLLVKGTVVQEYGVVSFLIDTLFVLDSLKKLPKPILTGTINEVFESKLVKLSKLIVVSGGMGNSNFLTVFNGSDTFKIKIDSLTNINDSLSIHPFYASDTICSVSGIVSQFDSTITLDSNYFIIPFSYSDFNCEKYRIIDTIRVCNYYKWSNGISYDSSQFISDTLFNINGCDSIIQLRLTIDTLNLHISQNNNMLTSMESGANYQWLDCKTNYTPISGETSKTFTTFQSGKFAVELVKNTCIDTSSCINITFANSYEYYDFNDFSIYPNPITNYINLEFDTEVQNVKLEVINALGKSIYSKYTNSRINKINIEGSEGIYFLKVTKEKSIGTFKFIKIANR